MFKRFYLIFIITIATNILSGCFKPVYLQKTDNNITIKQELENIEIDHIEGYLGYNLKAELDFLLSGEPSNKRKEKRYTLKIKTKESKTANIIDNTTGRAQTSFLKVEAVYLLLDKKEKDKILISGRIITSASYDKSMMRYTNLRTERNAEEKAAKNLAEKIKTIIIAALTNPNQQKEKQIIELSEPYIEEKLEKENE